MTTPQSDVIDLVDTIETFIENKNLPAISAAMTGVTPDELALVLERLADNDRAIVYRLLPKDRAMAVFDLFSPNMQGDLIHDLQDAEVAAIFAELDPDDRVWLLDELPATLAPRLLRGLSAKERDSFRSQLPRGSVGRRMSRSLNLGRTPPPATPWSGCAPDSTMPDGVRPAGLDDARKVIILSLAMCARRAGHLISDIMQTMWPRPTRPRECSAKCTNLGHTSLPGRGQEDRLVGVLRWTTPPDPQAGNRGHRASGWCGPLRRPYPATPVRSWSVPCCGCWCRHQATLTV